MHADKPLAFEPVEDGFPGGRVGDVQEVEVRRRIEEPHYVVRGEVVECDACEEIGLTLGEYLPKLVLWHRLEVLARPHQVSTFEVEGGTCRARGDVEDDDPAIGVSNLFHINAKAELIEDATLDVGRVAEGMAPDDPARRLVSHAEHELAAAFVTDGNAVLHELGR